MTTTDLSAFRDELLAAHPDDGSGNWLNALSRLGWHIVPRCRGLEFEIKYAPKVPAAGALGYYARALRSGLPPAVISPDWVRTSETEATFWLAEGFEWSLQRAKTGRERLKRKRHEVFRPVTGGPPLIQSSEEFVEDAEAVAAIVGGLSNRVGTLHKTRAKTYLLRLDRAMVFNITESRCFVGDAEQIQVELEYSCHLSKSSPDDIPQAGPDEIRNALWELAELLDPAFRSAGLAATTERKQDFLKSAQQGR